MQVTLAQLPQPAPPAPVSKPLPPPPPVPPQPVAPPKQVMPPPVPPKPLPAVIAKPPPVPSQIPVATQQELPPPPPPPPVRHVVRPAPHPFHRPLPVARPAPRSVPAPAAPASPPAAPAAPRAAPSAAAVPTRGIPIYGQRVYEIIQANQNVPAVLSEMGFSGTAVIEIVVAPDGKILSARVYKSSGVPVIDSTALQHARDAQLPPFNSDMPNQPHAFLVPIQIQPAND